MQKKKIFNLRPAVFVALSLCFGIATARFFILNQIFWAVTFILSTIILISFIFLKQNKEYNIKGKVIIAFICSIIFFIGGVAFCVSVNSYNKANLNDHYYEISGKVVDAKESDGGQHLILDKVYIDGNVNGRINYKIKIYVFGDGGFDIGDKIKFSSHLSDLSIIYEGKLNVYNILNGIKHTAELYSNQIDKIGYETTIFESINLFIRESLKSGLDKNEFALGYALLTGNSDFMDIEILSSYRMAGVAHIFAVSGLHIGFLAVAIGWFLDKIKCNRHTKAIVTSILLFTYSGVCGFSSSSIRASIMTAVALFCAVGGQRYDRLTAISISAITILLYSPISLFDVGFQLSFVVVIGICLWAAPIARALKFMPKKLAESLGVAIAAQIASIPVSLYHFKAFSLVAVFLNVVFIPAVSIIFTGLFTLTVFGGLLKISKITLFLPNYILKLLNFCITAIDFEVFMVGGIITLFLAFLCYWGLLFLSEQFNVKLLTRVVSSILCLAITLAGCVFVSNQNNSAVKMFVCGSERLSATIIYNRGETALIVSKADTVFSAGRLIRLSNVEGINNIDTVIFLSGFSGEEQAFLTKLRTAFTFDRVCVYGEEDKMLETILRKSFGNHVELNAYYDAEDMFIDGYSVKYALDGGVALINLHGKNIAVFSKVSGSHYAMLPGGYDYIIAEDMTEEIYGFFKPNNFISYRKSKLFTDGESQGNAVFNVL